MKLQLGLRSRLTVLVTVVFAAAMSITSLFVLRVVEDDLVADTRANAETVLGAYLETTYGGTATVGVVDANDTTRFFYLDGEGNELTDREYFEAIAAGLETDLAEALTGDLIGVPIGDLPPDFVAGGVIEGDVFPASGGALTISGIDPVTGELLDAQGGSVTFIAGPQPVGQPRSVDLGADVVGVAQTLTFTDGTTFDVGVSSPLRPVTDSLDTIRRLLWIAVPVLIAAIAVVTWLAASRALAPVHSVTARARAITAANIGDRLPVPDANDEIRELAVTMNALLARLEASQQRQHQFVADASHELRSPVAASTVQLEVAAADPIGTDLPATAATVLAEQQHLGRMIDDLLALSRIDEAGARRTEDVDLDDLIGAEVARPHPVAVRSDIAEPVRVRGDRALLARAIRNLVDNAAQHADAEVVVTLRSSDGVAVVDVDDDGPGIPSDEAERVFDRFARVDEARHGSAGGTGLGLAIVREVAIAHRGEVAVTASPLGGARLRVRIPTSDA